MGRSHAARRRRLAVTACVLWLLGVELLPNLHLAFHHDDHTHAPDGTIVRGAGVDRATLAHLEAHARGLDHEHDHDHDHDHHAGHHSERAFDEPAPAAAARHDHAPRRRRPQLAFHAPDPGHVAAGIAHRATALHQPPPPLVAPLAVPRAAWWIVDAPIARATETHEARPTARGPPVA